MSLHSPDKYIENIWDWGFLDVCFHPTRIKVTDVDGFIERNGLFLVIETKLPDVDIPQGQAIMFDSLIRTGIFQVLIIWGKRNQPEYRMFWGKGYEKRPTNTQEIIEIVRHWYKYANQQTISANRYRAG